MGCMRRKAAVCQKPKGKTPGFKPVSCEIVIASNFKDWQVLPLPLVFLARFPFSLWADEPDAVGVCPHLFLHVTLGAPQITAIDVIREVKSSNGGSLPQDWKKRILQDERVKPRAKEM